MLISIIITWIYIWIHIIFITLRIFRFRHTFLIIFIHILNNWKNLLKSLSIKRRNIFFICYFRIITLIIRFLFLFLYLFILMYSFQLSFKLDYQLFNWANNFLLHLLILKIILHYIFKIWFLLWLLRSLNFLFFKIINNLNQ